LTHKLILKYLLLKKEKEEAIDLVRRSNG